jgi:hypothetical protein
MKPFIDITGKRFHRLLVLRSAGQSKNRAFVFQCLCDCGVVKIYPGNLLMLGKIKSCGCFRHELLKFGRSQLSSHGHCTNGRSATYRSWISMKRRCSDHSIREYKRYGGRGIFVCDRWKIFKNFLEDMGPRPSGHTLDRIWNHLGYFPGNCKWSTPKEQTNNRGLGWLSNGIVYGMGEGI